jgi:FlgD Ig-like domain/Bacterial Ig-like domain
MGSELENNFYNRTKTIRRINMPSVKNCLAAKTVICALLLALAITHEALAQQFTVTAISPAHGATDVPLAATLSITFSAALDTSFRFANNELPVNLELRPDTAFTPPNSISFSPDLQTIRLNNLILQPNTRYVLLITGARSVSQAPLSRPATATFSTGPTLPSGSVSGTISYTGGASSALAGVFNALGDGAAAGYAIADNNGNYTVAYLPGGNYFALSIKDVNLDGEINPGKVDPIGGYDPDNNKLVNQFNLPGGSSLTGINITLRNPTPQTARELYTPAIENIAKATQSDAQLVALNSGNLGVDGKSTFWIYLFYSAALKKNFGFAGNDAIYFPFFDFQDGADTMSVALPPDWIDSKVALDSAQANLGREFLQKYPDAEIVGLAGTIDLGLGEGTATRFASGITSRGSLRLKKPRQAHLYKPGVQPQQVWLINYSDGSSGQSAFITLDMRTGKPVFIFRLTTALPNRAIAQAAALQWAPDAQLVLVASPPGTNFSPIDGTAAAWDFVYYSASKDSLRQFFIFFGNLSQQENVSDGPKQAIPSGWLDSDKTGPVAEALGGAAFRQMHPYPYAEVEAFMGYVNPAAPNRLVWSFHYISFVPQPDELIIYVDALIGVRVNDNSTIPNGFALLPPYPNPVRSGQNARWSFNAPTAVEARVEVYNVLGQQVAEILRGNLPAGESVLQWNGRLANGLPAASGAYFLRLEYRVANGKWQMMTQRVLLRK